MSHHGPYEIFADYYQFYLWDREINPLAPEDYSDEDVKRMIKTGPNVVAIQAVRNDMIPFELDILDAEPDLETEKWDHIAECSLELPSGHLQIHECTGGPVADFEIEPGAYRVRVLFGALDKNSPDGLDGKDHYLAQMWPESFRELEIIKQWDRPS